MKFERVIQSIGGAEVPCLKFTCPKCRRLLCIPCATLDIGDALPCPDCGSLTVFTEQDHLDVQRGLILEGIDPQVLPKA